MSGNMFDAFKSDVPNPKSVSDEDKEMEKRKKDYEDYMASKGNMNPIDRMRYEGSQLNIRKIKGE
jgi:hypothetical protein